MSAPSLILSLAPASQPAKSANAPPGPEPPGGFTIPSTEEVATKEPNAPAQKPDLGSTNTKPTDTKVDATQPASDLARASAGQVAIQILLGMGNASAFATPTVVPAPVPGVAIIPPGQPVTVAPSPIQTPFAGPDKPTAPLPASPKLEGDAPSQPIFGQAPAPTQTQTQIPVPTTPQALPTDAQNPIASIAVSLSTEPVVPAATVAPNPVVAEVMGAIETAAKGVGSVPQVPALPNPMAPVVALAVDPVANLVSSVVQAAPQPANPATGSKVTAKPAQEKSAEPIQAANTDATADEPRQIVTATRQSNSADGQSEEGQSDAEKTIAVAKTDSSSAEPEIAAELNRTSSITTVQATTTPKLSSAQTHAVIQQLTDRIELMAAVKPKDGMTVHLQPSDLGTVSMVVKTVGKAIEAQIMASNSNVRDALEDSKSQLAASVEHRGLQLLTVTVGSQASNSNNTPNQSGARQMAESSLNQSNSQHRQESSASGSRAASASPNTGSLEVRSGSNTHFARHGRGLDLAI